MWLDRAHLPLFGTQRGRGTAASLYTVFLLVQSGAHRPLHTASFDTAAESDVHFKLSLIPNCMLPVVIVQVVQVVHFDFGVFD